MHYSLAIILSSRSITLIWYSLKVSREQDVFINLNPNLIMKKIIFVERNLEEWYKEIFCIPLHQFHLQILILSVGKFWRNLNLNSNLKDCGLQPFFNWFFRQIQNRNWLSQNFFLSFFLSFYVLILSLSFNIYFWEQVL